MFEAWQPSYFLLPGRDLSIERTQSSYLRVPGGVVAITDVRLLNDVDYRPAPRPATPPTTRPSSPPAGGTTPEAGTGPATEQDAPPSQMAK